MIGYASNTGTKKNLTALRTANWRILLSPKNPKLPPGFKFAIDNGAFSAWNSNEDFDGDGFMALVETHGAAADFVVIPDKVASRYSLDFSRSWIGHLRHLRNLLIAVQDGMDFEDVGAFIRHERVGGIFLGGSIEWKLKTMYQWGAVAKSLGCYFHVGRVNTARRIRLCAEAAANSFDGTSATMYSCTLPLLDSARKQPSLLTPIGGAI